MATSRQAGQRLRRSDPNGPGIRRRRCGRGFAYRHDYGDQLDPEAEARIRTLAIPPAWREVWICPDPHGHLQAVGLDAAGRRQYLYHERWRQRRDALKFERMLEFGESMPRLRRRVKADLHVEGPVLCRPRVLATAVRLLDLGTFRIGNSEYAEEYETFGLTTLLRQHVQVGLGEARFTYVGKHGTDLVEVVHDEETYPVLQALRRRRAAATEQFWGWRSGHSWVPLRSEQVNEQLQQYAGIAVTAKDFRTWHASVLAAVALCGKPAGASTKTARRRAVNEVYRLVADALGNTPAVVRSSYVDPRLIDRYEHGVVLSDFCSVPSAGALDRDSAARHRIERGVIAMLQDA